MTRLFISALLVATIAIIESDAACRTMEEIDQCAYDFNIFTNRDVSMPTDDAAMVALCNRMKQGIACLKDHAINCLKGPTKAITLKMLNNAEQHTFDRCDNDNNRAEALRHIQCFTDTTKWNKLLLCGDRHSVMFEKVATFSPALRHGGGCCSGAAFHECLATVLRENCPSETVEYYDNLFKDEVEENIQMVCGQFPNMNTCDAKYDPSTWAELKKINALDNVDELKKNHKYKTIIPTLIQMMEGASRRRRRNSNSY